MIALGALTEWLGYLEGVDSYSVSARKDGSGWTVTCDQLPAAVAQVSAFSEIEDFIRDAISRESGTGLADFTVAVTVVD
jgi:hypothetical protein